MRTVSIVLLITCSSIGLSSAPAAPSSMAREGRQEEASANRPCACAEGQCKCCTGSVLQQLFDVNLRQRGCVNIAYDPDEFSFTMAMSFNDRVLYQNTFSGKNPRPACVSLPRLPSAKMCVRFSNVYFAGRNVHLCASLEGNWRDSTAFSYSFSCVRVGADGVAAVSPEEGGGLPQPQGPPSDPEDEEDYDVINEEDLLGRHLSVH